MIPLVQPSPLNCSEKASCFNGMFICNQLMWMKKMQSCTFQFGIFLLTSSYLLCIQYGTFLNSSLNENAVTTLGPLPWRFRKALFSELPVCFPNAHFTPANFNCFVTIRNQISSQFWHTNAKKLQDIVDIQMKFFKWNLTCCACFKNRKALSPLHTAIHEKLAVLLCSEV